MKNGGFPMNELEKAISRILNENMEELKNIVVDTILFEVADMVLECVYQEARKGNIRVEGVLMREDLHKAVKERIENN